MACEKGHDTPFATSGDGRRIFYQVDSLAPPWAARPDTAVMHHGVALNGDAWSEWLPTLLASGLTVVRIDMRGFGRSDQVDARYLWSMDDYFADIDAVRADIDLDSYHFVGESIGGLIGLALAARRPPHIKSLGLLSTPFDGSRIGAWRSIVEREGMAGWSQAMMPMRFAPGSIDNAFHNWVFASRRNGRRTP
jgi:3-oxoadipate enol-lactonase